MKLLSSLILLFSLPASHAEVNNDAIKRVKAKFLVNYKEMCLKGVKHKLEKPQFEKKCACQVKQFDENLSGDEIIKLFTSKDSLQYPELRSKANALIKQCE
jgi:hypothetical protein